MTTQAEKARDAQSKRKWIRAIIAISAVFVLGIAGVIYYGTVTLPAENKAKDVAACKTFLVAYSDANLAFLNEENAKDHKPSVETAVKAFADKLLNGYNKAYTQVGDSTGTVAKAIQSVALARLYLDTRTSDSTASTFSNLLSTTQTTEQVCHTTLDSANVKGKFGSYDSSKGSTPAASSSPAPSATK